MVCKPKQRSKRFRACLPLQRESPFMIFSHVFQREKDLGMSEETAVNGEPEAHQNGAAKKAGSSLALHKRKL